MIWSSQRPTTPSLMPPTSPLVGLPLHQAVLLHKQETLRPLLTTARWGAHTASQWLANNLPYSVNHPPKHQDTLLRQATPNPHQAIPLTRDTPINLPDTGDIHKDTPPRPLTGTGILRNNTVPRSSKCILPRRIRAVSIRTHIREEGNTAPLLVQDRPSPSPPQPHRR